MRIWFRTNNYGSGSGSGRPKNIRILLILIHSINKQVSRSILHFFICESYSTNPNKTTGWLRYCITFTFNLYSLFGTPYMQWSSAQSIPASNCVTTHVWIWKTETSHCTTSFVELYFFIMLQVLGLNCSVKFALRGISTFTHHRFGWLALLMLP